MKQEVTTKNESKQDLEMYVYGLVDQNDFSHMYLVLSTCEAFTFNG